ncbi:hypothetical protein D3C80_1914990 [compost metagenome]
MKTLSQRETHLVSGAGTKDYDDELYASDMEKLMKYMSPAQLAQAFPGRSKPNQYGGLTFRIGGKTFNVGPGGYQLDSIPPKTLPSFGVDVHVPIK